MRRVHRLQQATQNPLAEEIQQMKCLEYLNFILDQIVNADNKFMVQTSYIEELIRTNLHHLRIQDLERVKRMMEEGFRNKQQSQETGQFINYDLIQKQNYTLEQSSHLFNQTSLQTFLSFPTRNEYRNNLLRIRKNSDQRLIQSYQNFDDYFLELLQEPKVEQQNIQQKFKGPNLNSDQSKQFKVEQGRLQVQSLPKEPPKQSIQRIQPLKTPSEEQKASQNQKHQKPKEQQVQNNQPSQANIENLRQQGSLKVSKIIQETQNQQKSIGKKDVTPSFVAIKPNKKSKNVQKTDKNNDKIKSPDPSQQVAKKKVIAKKVIPPKRKKKQGQNQNTSVIVTNESPSYKNNESVQQKKEANLQADMLKKQQYCFKQKTPEQGKQKESQQNIKDISQQNLQGRKNFVLPYPNCESQNIALTACIKSLNFRYNEQKTKNSNQMIASQKLQSQRKEIVQSTIENKEKILVPGIEGSYGEIKNRNESMKIAAQAMISSNISMGMKEKKQISTEKRPEECQKTKNKKKGKLSEEEKQKRKNEKLQLREQKLKLKLELREKKSQEKKSKQSSREKKSKQKKPRVKKVQKQSQLSLVSQKNDQQNLKSKQQQPNLSKERKQDLMQENKEDNQSARGQLKTQNTSSKSIKNRLNVVNQPTILLDQNTKSKKELEIAQTNKESVESKACQQELPLNEDDEMSSKTKNFGKQYNKTDTLQNQKKINSIEEQQIKNSLIIDQGNSEHCKAHSHSKQLLSQLSSQVVCVSSKMELEQQEKGSASQKQMEILKIVPSIKRSSPPQEWKGERQPKYGSPKKKVKKICYESQLYEKPDYQKNNKDVEEYYRIQVFSLQQHQSQNQQEHVSDDSSLSAD